ncbi:hypothetical protein [Clostridium sp.]
MNKIMIQELTLNGSAHTNQLLKDIFCTSILIDIIISAMYHVWISRTS